MHSPATAEAIEARRTDTALTRGSRDYTGAAVVAWRCAVRGSRRKTMRCNILLRSCKMLAL